MKHELSDDLVWSLRALAQAPDTQRGLYPTFTVVADELVSDFGDAYTSYKEVHCANTDDLDRLDALIDTKSGVLEFWTDDALNNSKFWNEIRNQAKNILEVRGLTTDAPQPSSATYATSAQVWEAGQNKDNPVEHGSPSLMSRMLRRFGPRS